MIIADTFACAVNWGYTNISKCTSVDMLIVVLSYTMQIYFDFSGYSDMARGISIMLNIDLPVNFNSPYKAVSIREFWDRWHISLTRFLTKYIYIPLGGNRKGELRTYINILAVFLISGLWHGSNWTFLLWGGLYGIFMCIERRFDNLFQRIPKIITWAVTFAVVNFMWILFWTDSLEQTGIVLSRIIHFSGFGISSELEKCFCLKEFYILLDVIDLNFLNAHLLSLSMVLMIVGALAICMLAKNTNDIRGKNNASYKNLMFFVVISLYCILSLGYQTTEFIYKGF